MYQLTNVIIYNVPHQIVPWLHHSPVYLHTDVVDQIVKQYDSHQTIMDHVMLSPYDLVNILEVTHQYDPNISNIRTLIIRLVILL